MNAWSVVRVHLDSAGHKRLSRRRVDLRRQAGSYRALPKDYLPDPVIGQGGLRLGVVALPDLLLADCFPQGLERLPNVHVFGITDPEEFAEEEETLRADDTPAVAGLWEASLEQPPLVDEPQVALNLPRLRICTGLEPLGHIDDRGPCFFQSERLHVGPGDNYSPVEHAVPVGVWE